MLGETITQICEDPDMPCLRTIFWWLNPSSDFHKPEFLQLYSQAREIQAQVFLDQCIDIAGDSSSDHRKKYNKKGDDIGYEVDWDCVQRSRLMVDTRMKFIEKTMPWKYGQRINNAVQNPDGSPLQILEQIAASGTSRTQDILDKRLQEEREAEAETEE